MRNYAASIFLSLLLMCSCSEEEPAPGRPNGPSNNPDIVTPTGTENYLNLKSDYIFDQDKLHTFEINLPVADLAILDRDPTAEQYVEGSLTFEGETLGQVGVRYKGSIGAYVGCVSGSDWSNPSGQKTCTKLSMKIKVNWNDTDDKFYGLKKLQFHSQNLDRSQMRDRLGYHLFREMGVPAPRSTHARLVINGNYSGLYALVEQIDGRFTRENFEDGSGNLYKEIWPLSDDGKPYSTSQYLNALKTNEDENPTAEMIVSFGNEIANANQSQLKGVISKWMDVDEIISYAVVDRTIRVDDGPFHWYCGGGECTNHNYYWYEEPTQRTLHLVTWDLDNAFENIVNDNNPVTPIADDWGEISSNCAPFRHGAFGLLQRSATCDQLTKGWTLFEEEYTLKKEAFINGPFAEDKINALIDQWSAQIRDATIEAQDMHSDALTVARWEGAVEQLKASLNFARNK